MFDLISPNHVSDTGFVAAVQSASLGNALTTMATMFELTQRTGIATAYPFLLDTSARYICADAALPTFGLNGSSGHIDLPSLVATTQQISEWIGGVGAVNGLSAAMRRPADLQMMDPVRGKLIVVTSPQVFSSMAKLQPTLLKLCARGNGIILTGAYWPQYMPEDGEVAQSLRYKLRATSDPGSRGARSVVANMLNIGVHIRQGDYRIWSGGRYFFDLDAYIVVMRSIISHYPSAQFHIFSNENFARSDFPDDMPINVAAGETDAADFLNLGRCDFIVGPPSTYGTWAAYLGKAQRLILTPERIEALRSGADPETMLSKIDRPTFSYAPGVNGPL